LSLGAELGAGVLGDKTSESVDGAEMIIVGDVVTPASSS